MSLSGFNIVNQSEIEHDARLFEPVIIFFVNILPYFSARIRANTPSLFMKKIYAQYDSVFSK
jgi:hypothetical protein